MGTLAHFWAAHKETATSDDKKWENITEAQFIKAGGDKGGFKKWQAHHAALASGTSATSATSGEEK